MPLPTLAYPRVQNPVEDQLVPSRLAGETAGGDVQIPGTVIVTPTLGAELLTNPDFSAWAGDNPTGWTNSVEDGSNFVTQVGAGGGAGTGKARIAAATNGAWRIQQSVLTVGSWYQVGVEVDTVVSGAIRLHDNATAYDKTFNTTGVKLLTAKAGFTIAMFQVSGLPTDVTIDNATVKLLTFSTLFYTLSDAFVPRVIEAMITRTANTQAGVAHYSDDNNVVIAYLDGTSNVVLLKRVTGTYTQVATSAVTYVAGALLRLTYDPVASTYTVIYDGVTKINAASVTDAVFVTAKGSRLFSTHASNSFTNIRASASPN